MTFTVGDLFETFGTLTEAQASGEEKGTVFRFDENNKLNGLSGDSERTGMGNLSVQSLNLDCVALDVKQKEEQEMLNAALSGTHFADGNVTKTIVVSFVMLFAIMIIAAIICFCAKKDLTDRLNKTYAEEKKLVEEGGKNHRCVSKEDRVAKKAPGMVIVEDYRESEPVVPLAEDDE